MQTRPLGQTGMHVSRLCLGTMTFGEQNSEAEAHAQLDRATAAGINFIDTAGVEMLLQEVRRLTDQGGELMISSLKGTVMDELRRRGDLKRIGEARFFENPEAAIASITPALDPDVCQGCAKRVFGECASKPSPELGVLASQV